MGGEPAGRLPVVFIAGTGRSGSTLLAQLIERSADAIHPGELRYLWDRGVGQNHLCECGHPFDRCEFWTEVLRAAYGSDVASVADRLSVLRPRVDRLRHIPRAYRGRHPDFARAMGEYSELITPLYRNIASVAGRQVVVDSSKDPTYLYVLHNVPALDLRPLHLLRDPRAVAHSWTRRRRRSEIYWVIQYMRTVPPWTTACNWLLYNAAIALLTRRYRFATRLRYEDFAQDPSAITARVIDTLDLPARSPSGLSVGHSLSGNPLRFDAVPRAIQPDVEWRSALKARDRRVVTSITLPLLHRFGYPVRPDKAKERTCV